MRELKIGEWALIAAVVGVVSLLGLGMLPTSLAPYATQLSQLNVEITAVLLIILFSIGMVVAWPKLRVPLQTILVLVFLVVGIGLALPAFIAIAVVGLVLTMALTWTKRGMYK